MGKQQPLPYIRVPFELGMAEIVNLRNARKRAMRRQREDSAASNRLAHGVSQAERSLAEAQVEKARRSLDSHRIETGDDR